MDELLATLTPLVRAHDLVFEQTILSGFERLPATLQSLFTGSHRGKLIVQLLPS